MTAIVNGAGNKENGVSFWEKQAKDMNNVDEKFANARDMGYLRLNYARSTVVASLAKYDSVDNYKIQVQSNGKLSVSLRSGEDDKDKKHLDTAKYDKAMEEAQKVIDEGRRIADPVAYNEEQIKKLLEKKETEFNILKESAPGLRLEVYTIKNGKEILVADSHAERGTKEREAADLMLTGEYRAQKGDYYVKVTRDDTVGADSEQNYALQMNLGKSYKHDYLLTEGPSEDTKNKKISNVPQAGMSGNLSSVNALQIQASKYQATGQMLQIGYLNMADIYGKNNKLL